jgi:hypothetical protein
MVESKITRGPQLMILAIILLWLMALCGSSFFPRKLIKNNFSRSDFTAAPKAIGPGYPETPGQGSPPESPESLSLTRQEYNWWKRLPWALNTYYLVMIPGVDFGTQDAYPNERVGLPPTPTVSSPPYGIPEINGNTGAKLDYSYRLGTQKEVS